MGGDEINQEIAYAFDTSIEEAKRAKKKIMELQNHQHSKKIV